MEMKTAEKSIAYLQNGFRRGFKILELMLALWKSTLRVNYYLLAISKILGDMSVLLSLEG